jgi:hypothetical protein
MNPPPSIALFEHRFWLQILGDHARFIFTSLAMTEQHQLQQANSFIENLDQLLGEARQAKNGAEVAALTQRAYQQAQALRAFKLEILKAHLTVGVQTSLSPTFYNHMVNEVEEYLRILGFLMAGGQPPLLPPLHYHLLWLKDAEGHASGLRVRFDDTEREFIERSDSFRIRFNDYYNQSVEFSGYQRTGLADFPALARLNFTVETVMQDFREFLATVGGAVRSKEALSVLSPLIPDHMDREECYYLIKLAQVSQVRPPDCDPARPRVNN